MILYKYMDFESAKRVIETRHIRFTQPHHFNDPFDFPRFPPLEEVNQIEGMFNGIGQMFKGQIMANTTGILCLTRTPTNPLMWAHYADKHGGFVIGIDAIRTGFVDVEINLIPAQFGSMVYVSQRPTYPLADAIRGEGMIPGDTYNFMQNHYEKLQRLFLYKALYWSYEEEVRVEKCILEKI